MSNLKIQGLKNVVKFKSKGPKKLKRNMQLKQVLANGKNDDLNVDGSYFTQRV